MSASGRSRAGGSPRAAIPARILGTGASLGARRIPTAEMAAAVGRDPAVVLERTGIASRSFVGEDETVASLGEAAVRAALARAGCDPSSLRRLILATSTGGDTLIPATANALLERLGVRDRCDGFDLNNACMGFLSAFDVGVRTVATGRFPVCVIAVETLSRYLDPEAPRPWLVLGDAAAAVILDEARDGAGVIASAFGNDGAHRGSVALAHPGRSGRRERIEFAASNDAIAGVAFAAMERCAREVLGEAGLGFADVEWVVPHQPNGKLLGELVRRFGIAPDRVAQVVEEVGSVGAASMAFGLDRLLRTRPVAAGDRILLLGVGAGLAYGAALYRVGEQAFPWA